MRGDAERQSNIMLAVTPESFIPGDHPIRRIKPIVDAALQRLAPLFDAMYARRGRPSIPPEHLLKASLLIALYSIRSERQFCERLRYGLLFKWFLDLNISDEPFAASSFSKNRERLLAADAAHAASPRWWPRQSGTGCSPPSTSPWTGRCWRPGPRSRATARATGRSRREAAGVTRTWTSAGGSAAAIRMFLRPTRRRSCIRSRCTPS